MEPLSDKETLDIRRLNWNIKTFTFYIYRVVLSPQLQDPGFDPKLSYCLCGVCADHVNVRVLGFLQVLWFLHTSQNMSTGKLAELLEVEILLSSILSIMSVVQLLQF